MRFTTHEQYIILSTLIEYKAEVYNEYLERDRNGEDVSEFSIHINELKSLILKILENDK